MWRLLLFFFLREIPIIRRARRARKNGAVDFADIARSRTQEIAYHVVIVISRHHTRRPLRVEMGDLRKIHRAATAKHYFEIIQQRYPIENKTNASPSGGRYNGSCTIFF